MQRKLSERGQVMVIFALAFIGVVGFVALAIDGGNIYADRRQAQAASDTAAMSAALAIMSGYGPGQVRQVALLKAEDNGYGHSPPKTTVVVNWPPASPHPYAGNPNYVQVLITNQVDTFFAHLFYPGPLKQTVQSVAHVSLNEDLAPGYAVYGENPSACPAIQFDGAQDTYVSGGGSILSNSLAECSCGPNGGAGVNEGSGSVTIADPSTAGIYAAGEWCEYPSSYDSSPEPTSGAGQESIDPPPIPDCSGLPDHRSEGDRVIKGTATLAPGRYDSLWFTSSSAEITMGPGIYCLEGEIDGISEALAFHADAGTAVNGSDVMIFLGDGAGGLRTAGTANITLEAGDPTGASVPELIDASGEDWRGMLLYSHPDNGNEIHISGSSGSTYTGSIYAPGIHCTVQGSGGAIGLNTQLICDTLRITGNGDLNINYDMEKNYQREEQIELFD